MRPSNILSASGRGSACDPPTRPLPRGQLLSPPPDDQGRGPGPVPLTAVPGRPGSRVPWGTIRAAAVTAVVVAIGLLVGFLGFLGVANGG